MESLGQRVYGAGVREPSFTWGVFFIFYIIIYEDTGRVQKRLQYILKITFESGNSA